MTDQDRATTRHAASPEADIGDGSTARARRRVSRRRLIKGAAVTAAGVVGASGYVRPSVRPLQVPVAHAFTF